VRRAIYILLMIGLLAGAGAAGWWSLSRGTASEAPYRLANADRGSIVASVRATGTHNPVTTVLVGSQLSGQIVDIFVDYNSPVKEGQVLARLFSDQIKTRRDAAAADLAQRRAELPQRRAQLDKAMATRQRADAALRDLRAQRDRAAAQLLDNKRNADRQEDLFKRNVGSRTALDAAKTQAEMQTASVASAEAQIAAATADLTGLDADIKNQEAQVQSAEAQILAAEAKLKDIEIDLSRTDIRSPVDGVVVQRQIDLGQTVAASLNAPTLFTVAQDLREIDIWANVDESDVGRIKDGQRVTFTVNAYPNRTFEGTVKMVRLGAQTVQNVVTYTTIVRVDNRDLALLPGMTANLQIITDERPSVLRIPNAALRFRPPGAPAGVAGAPTVPQGEEGRSGRGQAARQLRERIVAELKPTPQQMVSIDAAFEEARNSPLVRDPSLTPEERRSAVQTIMRSLRQQVAGALDAERRERFIGMLRDASAARAAGDGLPARIYVSDAEGQPQPLDIRIGVTDGSFTEVLTGNLKEGIAVITGGGPKTAAEAPKGPRIRFF
jgi:HlyD family secretion protein